MGDKGRQDVEKADTPFQQRETRREMGDKGKQDLGKADTPSNTDRQEETRPREGGHTKAEAPSKTGTHVGRQWETKREDKTSKRRTIQHRHTCGETMRENGEQWGTRGDQGDKTSKRRAHHPRKGNKKGGGRQWKTTRRDKTLGRRTRHPTQTYIVGRQWETKGDKERQGETRPREGGNAIRQTKHHRHTCEE